MGAGSLQQLAGLHIGHVRLRPDGEAEAPSLAALADGLLDLGQGAQTFAEFGSDLRVCNSRGLVIRQLLKSDVAARSLAGLAGVCLALLPMHSSSKLG